jgi:hypothetical protein
MFEGDFDIAHRCTNGLGEGCDSVFWRYAADHQASRPGFPWCTEHLTECNWDHPRGDGPFLHVIDYRPCWPLIAQMYWYEGQDCDNVGVLMRFAEWRSESPGCLQ